VIVPVRNEDHEPADAAADGAPDRRREVRLVRSTLLHSAQAQHILAALLNQDVDNIIDRHDAEHPAAFLDDRDGQKVVLRDQPGHLLLVGLRRDLGQRGGHNHVKALGGRSPEQGA